MFTTKLGRLEHQSNIRFASETLSLASAPASLQTKCAHCEEEERALQKKPDITSSSRQSLHPEAPPLVHQVLSSPGQALPAADLSFFQSRFGFDFSRVRVHSDRAAAESASSVNALAYTAGSDIAFAAGQYQPGTETGSRLLAHELAHVVQQSGAGPFVAPLRMGETGSLFEHEADRAAATVSSNGFGSIVASSPDQVIQRDSAKDSTTPPPPSPCGNDGRQLTADERSVAEFVFGQALNPDPICIRESSVMSVGGYVRTVPTNSPDGTLLSIIYVSRGMKDTISRSLLVHELTHCAQYQHGVPLLVTAPYAIWAHYDYGGEQGLLDAIKNKKCFDHFNTEQQADIVKDYYGRVVNNQSTYPWDVFVNQVRAQGACKWPSEPQPAPEKRPSSPGIETA
jgi:Domain of unknown function (DUF4157)